MKIQLTDHNIHCQRKRRLTLLRWKKRFFKHLPPVSLFILFCIVIFGAGFFYFSEKISRLAPPDPLPVADGIIVLTGGESRLEAGLDLLAKGRGKRLLISGVNPSTNSQSLIRVTHSDPKLFDCCVDLGHEAINTIGNAEEATDWIKKNHYQRVYIVTNDYHMPRSLRELNRLMPATEFIAYPISDSNGEQSWLHQFTELRLLASEYVKFIGAELQSRF
ncbi:YdcF family protein [uncultured Bartonella sp.]|uniref:YdcF family protein n=1 Tax=uncultured Bartonella sp. TaxID=104108 RepID=UPI00261128F4|nr:YdcF family protein [uncultured Bartonella sp.]